jgi:hypothetical protein
MSYGRIRTYRRKSYGLSSKLGFLNVVFLPPLKSGLGLLFFLFTRWALLRIMALTQPFIVPVAAIAMIAAGAFWTGSVTANSGTAMWAVFAHHRTRFRNAFNRAKASCRFLK